MTSVNMFEAKTNLSKYVSCVEERKEPYIVIMRHGKPVARIVPYEDPCQNRIGQGKGIIPVMGDLDDFNSVDVEQIFTGDGGLL